jgi:hypothetical protein
MPNPNSIRFDTTAFNGDSCTITGTPAAGILLTGWSKNIHQTGAYPHTYANLYAAELHGSNWGVQLIMGNCNGGVASSGANGNYNSNISFYDGNNSGAGGTYLGDWNTLLISKPESDIEGWVFNAWWVYNDTASGKISVYQYTIFPSAPTTVVTPNINTQTIAQTYAALTFTVTPGPITAMRIGDAENANSNTYDGSHFRIYDGLTTAPSNAAVLAIAQSYGPDSAAWADWFLEWSGSADVTDHSGHGRNLTISPGVLGAGVAGPLSAAIIPSGNSAGWPIGGNMGVVSMLAASPPSSAVLVATNAATTNSTAGLTTVIPLQANMPAVTAQSAGLASTIALTVAGSAQTSAGAAITTGVSLSSTGAAITALSANLTTFAAGAVLVASSAAVTSGSAGLSTAVPMVAGNAAVPVGGTGNMFASSEVVGAPDWINGYMSFITPNAGIGMQGGMTADLIGRNNVSGSAYLGAMMSRQAVAGWYTVSFYVRPNVGNYFAVQMASYIANSSVVFDIVNGVISTAAAPMNTGTGASASITPVGGGVFLCSLSTQMDANTALAANIMASSNGAAIGTADIVNNSSAYVLASQMVAGQQVVAYNFTNGVGGNGRGALTTVIPAAVNASAAPASSANLTTGTTGAALVATASALTSTVNPDASFSNVTVLLHGEGPSVVDSGPLGLTFTNLGGTTSSAHPIVGAKALTFTDGGYLQNTGSGATQLGTGDFTIETWLNLTNSNASTYNLVFDGATGGANSNRVGTFCCYVTSSGQLTVYNISGSYTTPTGLTFGGDTHVAWERANGILTAYIGGNAAASWAFTTNETVGGITVANGDNSKGTAGSSAVGYLDEFRITKGVARYLGNFTPVKNPFPDASNNSIARAMMSIPSILVGNQAATTASSAGLSTGIPLAAATSAVTGGTTALTATSNAYGATGSAVTGGSAGLSTAIPIQATGSAVTGASANLQAGNGLYSTSAATTTGTGSLSTSIPLAGTKAATTAESAALGSTISLGVAGNAVTAGTALLTSPGASFGASGSATSGGSASLTSQVALLAANAAASAATAQLLTIVQLAASATATTAGSGVFGVTGASLQTASAAKTLAAAALTTKILMQAAYGATPSSAAGLSTQITGNSKRIVIGSANNRTASATGSLNRKVSSDY